MLTFPHTCKACKSDLQVPKFNPVLFLWGSQTNKTIKRTHAYFLSMWVGRAKRLKEVSSCLRIGCINVLQKVHWVAIPVIQWIHGRMNGQKRTVSQLEPREIDLQTVVCLAGLANSEKVNKMLCFQGVKTDTQKN